MNAYETEAMQQMLEEGVRNRAVFGESRCLCDQYLFRNKYGRPQIKTDAAPGKKRNPDAAVVAAGCYVQTKEDEAKCDEAIDILIGNNQKKNW